MNLDYFIYNESDKISIKSKQSNYITFYGEMNDYLIKNIMLINENDYVTLNFSKASKKNITKYYKLIRMSSYTFINTEHAETVMDELAFPLESLGMKKESMDKSILELSNKFNFNNYLEVSPSSLPVSKKVVLNIMCSLIVEPKLLVIDNLLSSLDKEDLITTLNVLNEFKRGGLIIFNFTTDIESSLFGDEIIITDKEKIIVSGKTMSVLNEEKIMKRLGLGLPFIVMLNKYLIDYNLIDKYILDYKLLGGKLWN